DVFKRVSDDLKIRQHALGLNPYVHDYLSDSEIKAGVTFYTSGARFKVQTNPLKCDRGVLDNDENLIRDWHCVGKHMWYANERTAFHYGFHRGLKGQTEIMERVRNAYHKH